MTCITNSQITGGSTVLTLADKTRNTLQGVANLYQQPLTLTLG